MALILHRGARIVTFEEVAAAPMPAQTGSYFPIGHARLVEEVLGQLREENGVIREEHSLSQDGARYFGTFELAEREEKKVGTIIGVRNTHDKSFGAGLVMGSRVFVCDNLAFSGEVALARRHTRYIERDLPGLVARAVGALGDFRQQHERRAAAYQEHLLSSLHAHDLLIRALKARAVTPQDLPRVLREYEKPRHEEFAPRTAWSMFNAFTEVAKGQSLALLSRRTQKLHGVFDTTCGFN